MGRLYTYAVLVAWLIIFAACDSTTSDDDGSATSGGGSTSVGGGGTGGSGPCMAHTDCAEDRICLAGVCELAWGREYRFTVISADIAEQKPDGSSWDGLSGDFPDPFVEMRVSNDVVFTTTVIDDTLSPTWNEPYDHPLQENGGPIQFVMFHEDAAFDDTIIADASGSPPAVWLDDVRTGGGQQIIGESGSTLLIRIEPL